MVLSPTIFDHDVAALHIAALIQSPTKRSNTGVVLRSCTVEESYHRHRRLLRPRRQRPCRRRAEKGDELAALHHSITSSAIESTSCETSRPSALAVLRLITNSNLVGCNTGSSAGFSPLRIRAT